MFGEKEPIQKKSKCFLNDKCPLLLFPVSADFQLGHVRFWVWALDLGVHAPKVNNLAQFLISRSGKRHEILQFFYKFLQNPSVASLWIIL